MSLELLTKMARFISARKWAEGGREAVILDRLKTASGDLSHQLDEWDIEFDDQEDMLCRCIGFSSRDMLPANVLTPVLPQRPEALRNFMASRPVLLFKPSSRKVIVGTRDPMVASQKEQLSLLLGVPVDLVYLREEELQSGRQMLGSQLGKIVVDQQETSSPVERYNEESGPVVQLVDLIIQEAITQKASDIHVEPFEAKGVVRYRVDGVLKVARDYSIELHSAITSRIKLVAGLDIAERRIPQDGRIRYDSAGADIDIRVATIPTNFGEGVVMRLLFRANVKVDLDRAGFRPDLLRNFRDAFSAAQGIILVTGPTGSGKSTTLYGMLNELNKPDRKIFTIEDPIEYILEGVVQVPVNPKVGMTFAAGLRSFLRCDPDIIMVGEIRDQETGEIAVKAALTGHLVLATLHTNSAPSTLTRLVDMGLAPYNLSATIQGILAQRLLRKVCKACSVPGRVDQSVRDLFEQNNVPLSRPILDEQGCEKCGFTGFKGRLGTHEFLPMTDALRAAVNRSAPDVELENIAASEGMNTLLQDGLLKVLTQDTTVREVLRVMGGVLGD